MGRIDDILNRNPPEEWSYNPIYTRIATEVDQLRAWSKAWKAAAKEERETAVAFEKALTAAEERAEAAEKKLELQSYELNVLAAFAKDMAALKEAADRTLAEEREKQQQSAKWVRFILQANRKQIEELEETIWPAGKPKWEQLLP